MKITGVKLYPIKTRRDMLDVVSRHVIMRISTDEGIVGLGEISDVGHTEMMPDLEDFASNLTALLEGRDPFQIAAINMSLRGRYGGPIGGETVAAVDFALHDIVGKALGTPVFNLLGGKVRDRIPVCYPIFTRRTEEDIYEDLTRVEFVYREGFNRIRIYVGDNLEADELFLKRLRERYGTEIQIKSLDFSHRLHWKEAVRAIKRFLPYEFELVESIAKRGDWAGMAEARKQVPVPVSEHVPDFATAAQIIEKGACDVFNISPVSFGLTNARKLYAVAKAFGMEVLIGTTQELSIATAAVAHLGASLEELDHPCDSVGPRLYVEDVVVSRVKYENGELLVPEGVGLGMELDEEKLAALASPLTWRRE